VDIWIVYRKGSFSLKERVRDEALVEQRKSALARQGATHVRVEAENSPRLKRALELPHLPLDGEVNLAL
jgi:hypothetical protein